ncbi:MAG: transcriptional repressor [Ruminiclostridium sp.]|nr:transcriptional repressor [Ruminiclostridium sp.]MBQ8842889.1 transcriptional repressor [Ruminiclostridium sp.]
MGYKTKQGGLIFGLLEKYSDRHLTAEEICGMLKAEGTSVGTATVYRNLEKLVSEGKVRRYRLEEGESACYQYMGDVECHEHFHLKCINCGVVIHLECDYLDEINGHLLEHHGFNLDRTKIVLYGECAECGKGRRNEAD